MPALIIYLIKVNGVLILFYLAYRLLLRPLTFYSVNRFFLLFAIVFSTVYPLMDLSSFFRKSPVISETLVTVVPDWQVSRVPAAPVITGAAAIDGWHLLELVFWAGVALFFIRLIVRLLSLYRLHKKSFPATWNDYHFRTTSENIPPFSFMRSIYLNERQVREPGLENLLSHEQVHTSELHTADVLLSELNTVFYWFNPGAWLMKNAVKENLEFITDRRVLQGGADSRAYQYSLLEISLSKQSLSIVNHFNLLTLKNRIVMMNKERSSRLQVAKYVLLLPLVMGLSMIFTVSRAQLERSGKSLMAAIRPVISTEMIVPSVKPVVKHQPLVKPVKVVAEKYALALPAENNEAQPAPAATESRTDTTFYNVDGKAVSSINQLSPDDISYVQVLKGEQAVKVFGPDYAKGVIFVVTKANRASDAVMQIQKKMTDVSPRSLTLTSGTPIERMNINGVTVIGGRLTGKGDTLSSHLAPTLVIRGNALSTTAPVSVISRSSGLTTVTENNKVYTSSPAARVVIAGGGRSFYAPAQATHNVVILLDGKEVSEEQMKKFPARKIKSINVDNGVVRISSKN